MRIVFADDNADLVLAYMMIFSAQGHDVHGVYDANDVLPLVRRVRPEAVVLDLAMPEKSGFEIAEDLKTRYDGNPLMIAITGKHTHKRDLERSMSAGFHYYLLKPCDPDELHALLIYAGLGAGGY